MCTPVGHTLMGCTLFFGSRKAGQPINWLLIGMVVVLANLPDMDFLFGLSQRNPNLYHHYWTHSLGFVVLTGILAGGVTGFIKKDKVFKMSALASGLVLAHIFLDYFTRDMGPPYGLQLFWPLNNSFFIAPVIIFQDVNKASSSSAFIGSLFCWHNLWAIVSEILILGPVFLISWLLFRRRKIALGKQ